MKISSGLEEDGIIIGNTYDKYGSRNPIVRWIMRGFADSLATFVSKVSPRTIHEIGCSEGCWVINWNRQGIKARGSDFSKNIIDLACENAIIYSHDISPSVFAVNSIFDIKPELDSADLVLCCEVLEYFEDPEAALASLQYTAKDYVILSLPREPTWCALNFIRGK